MFPARPLALCACLQLLPNPVHQRQSEAVQRQQAVTAFTQRLQTEHELSRAKAALQQQARAAELAEETEQQAAAAKAAAAAVTQVPEPPPLPIKPRPKAKSAKAGSASGPSGPTAAALGGLERAVGAEEAAEQEPKRVDPKPWRQNMRRRPTPLASEPPAGEPLPVAPQPAATGGPPPQSLAPAAAGGGARMKDQDPVTQAALRVSGVGWAGASQW